MLVQRFEPQGRRCTHFHYYSYSGLNVHIISLTDGKAKHVFGHYIALLHINFIRFHFSRVTLWVGKMLW